MDEPGARRPESRPPSEQTPEHRTLELVEALARKVDELASKPAVIVQAGGNWWDQLPPEVGENLSEGTWSTWQLMSKRPNMYYALRIGQHYDRLELQLQVNGGQILWQRALFYGSPAAV